MGVNWYAGGGEEKEMTIRRRVQLVKHGEGTTDTWAGHHLNRWYDWELRLDLDEKLVFSYIMETNQRLEC